MYQELSITPWSIEDINLQRSLDNLAGNTAFKEQKDKTSLQENIYSLLKDYEWRLRGSDVKTAGKVHLSEHSIKMQLDVETSHCYIYKPLISNMAKKFYSVDDRPPMCCNSPLKGNFLTQLVDFISNILDR